MKHVTEEYAQSCNHIVCTNEEFWILKAAFRQHGVRVRMISEYKGEITFQIINPYKDYAILFGQKRICKSAEDEIEIDR